MKKQLPSAHSFILGCILVLSFGSNLIAQFAPFTTNPYALTRPPIFGSSPFQDSLWAIDTTTYGVNYRIGPTPSSGGTITGMTGLTMHPHTGEIYIICKQSATTGRTLGKFNPLTGVVTIIGNLGDNFSSISFEENGQLRGATGNGATVPEAMYLINHTNATITLAYTMGNGADGEVLAYNYDDNSYYHWSGNGTMVMEKMLATNLTYTPTNIVTSGLSSGETFGAVYLGNGEFIISNISSQFKRVTSSGTYGPALGAFPDDLRGLALIPRWITGPLVETTSVCATDTVTLEALATPNETNSHKFQWVHNGANIPGATSSTYNVTQATGSGRYNCRIMLDSLNANNQTMDSAITAYTDTAWFGRTIVFNPSAGLSPSPVGYLCSATDTITLVNTNQGTNQWYLNGVVLAGETNDTLWATTVGDYNVTATLVAGCADTMVTATTVSIAPAASLTSSTNLCFGDTVLLSANAGSSNYDWLFNGSLLTSTSIELLNVSADGNYSVVTTFGDCVDTSNIAALDFAPQYDVTPAGSGSICIGSNQLLTATAGGSSYQWLMNGAAIGGATTATFTATATGVYACLITFPGCTDTTVTSYNLTAVDCSGIEETHATVVSLYPNPVHTQLNVSTSNNIAIQQIEIVDLSGRKVIHVKPNGSNASINVEDLRSGTYLITITTENGVKTKRFVKN
jgi:hypothetical protein